MKRIIKVICTIYIAIILTSCTLDWADDVSIYGEYSEVEVYPVTIPSAFIYSDIGLSKALKVSHEWPNQDKYIPEYEYVNLPIDWPSTVPVSDNLKILWDTIIPPESIEIWMYDKRDSDGIPINDPIGYLWCGYVGSGFSPCPFVEDDMGISITTRRVGHSDQSTLVIVQAEWMTSPDTDFHTARASWALILQSGLMVW